MKLLPIAERELRVSARRPATYWVRFGAVALALAAAVVVFLAMLRERPMEQAQVLFLTLSGLAFVYCLASGVLTTSDCVSEEKRDGTLGLLFLTDLRGYDVVAGKLVASSVRAVSALVALLPVLALPLLMGSISGGAVRNVVLVLANTMFLSLALGVLVSAWSRDARHAVGGTVLALLVLLALLPLGRWLWLEYVVRQGAMPAAAPGTGPVWGSLGWILSVNPAVAFSLAMESVFRGATPRGEFWLSLGVQHGLAWGALVAACVTLPHQWRDRADPARRGRGEGGTAAGGVGSASARERGELLDVHPFAWIVGRERKVVWVSWAGLVVIAAVWCWGFAEVREEWLQGFIGLWTVFFAAIWLKLRLASSACRHLHEHRRTGALELVLCTAQTPSSLVHGHLTGLRYFISPLAVTVVVAGGLLMVAGLGQDRGGGDAGEMLVLFAVGSGMLLLDLYALSWVGMWQGLRSGRYVRAYAVSVAWVMLLPWVAFVVSLVLIAVLVEVLHLGTSVDPQFGSLVGWWVFLSVGVDAWAVVVSRRRLLERFREMAVGHYGPLGGGEARAAAASTVPAPVAAAEAVAVDGGGRGENHRDPGAGLA